MLARPLAFRPLEEAANVLMSACSPTSRRRCSLTMKHNKPLRELEADIDAVTLDGLDVPVKLKVFDSLFVLLAKWVDAADRQLPLHHAQRAAVDPRCRARRFKRSQTIYDHAGVDAIACKLGADPQDQVPFAKYAKAAESLLAVPAARAVASGALSIERVDLPGEADLGISSACPIPRSTARSRRWTRS